MYVKKMVIKLSTFLLKYISIMISNKLFMEKLIMTFSSWKTELFAISMYKSDINLDIAQKEHEI